MSKFRLAKVRISESFPKVHNYVPYYYTWYITGLHQNLIWQKCISPYVNFCLNAKVYNSMRFMAKVHILQLVRCVCLSFNSYKIRRLFITTFLKCFLHAIKHCLQLFKMFSQFACYHAVTELYRERKLSNSNISE